MSSIFKTRKVPKHLIIQEEFNFRRRSRFSLWRVLWWIILLTVATLAIVELGNMMLQT